MPLKSESVWNKFWSNPVIQFATAPFRWVARQLKALWAKITGSSRKEREKALRDLWTLQEHLRASSDRDFKYLSIDEKILDMQDSCTNALSERVDELAKKYEKFLSPKEGQVRSYISELLSEKAKLGEEPQKAFLEMLKKTNKAINEWEAELEKEPAKIATASANLPQTQLEEPVPIATLIQNAQKRLAEAETSKQKADTFCKENANAYPTVDTWTLKSHISELKSKLEANSFNQPHEVYYLSYVIDTLQEDIKTIDQEIEQVRTKEQERAQKEETSRRQAREEDRERLKKEQQGLDMSLMIMDMKGHKDMIPCDSNDTVKDLLERLQKAHPYYEKEGRLICGGKKLDPEQRLIDIEAVIGSENYKMHYLPPPLQPAVVFSGTPSLEEQHRSRVESLKAEVEETAKGKKTTP